LYTQARARTHTHTHTDTYIRTLFLNVCCFRLSYARSGTITNTRPTRPANSIRGSSIIIYYCCGRIVQNNVTPVRWREEIFLFSQHCPGKENCTCRTRKFRISYYISHSRFPSSSSSSSYSSSVTLFTVRIITSSGTRLVVCCVRIYHSRTCWATVLVIVDHLSVCVHFTIYFSRRVVSVKTHWIPLLWTCAPVPDVIDWNICSCRWSLDVVFCTRAHDAIVYYIIFVTEMRIQKKTLRHQPSI